MNKENYVLAVMSAAQTNELSPVRVQKLFFLLDEDASELVGGPHFNFFPYDYGPFDKDVYAVFEALEGKELVAIVPPNFNHPRMYRLTDKGLSTGKKLLESFPEETQDYIAELVEWIRSKSFTQIVSTIYKFYPEMKTNSVFGN